LYNPAMPEWVGKTVGKVRIEKYLARGGMAEVYLGTHLTLERPVAVKVLHRHIEDNPDLMMRFQREAKVVAGLRHPNIVQLYDFDTIDGHPYIVMEYLRGPSLAAYLRALHERGERLSAHLVAGLLKSVASALDYAHAQGVIHRDIKPGNILLHGKADEIFLDRMLTDDVEAILTDFGLVRIAHAATQTASGLVSGTPAYMSPEQARGDKVDYHTDIYSLGVVLYEMIAGRVPFEGDSTMAVIYKHIHEPPPRIEGVPELVQAVIDRALAKDPNERYQSARSLAADFYRAIGMKAEAETIQAGLALPPPPARSPQAQRPKTRRDPVLIGGIIFACACLSALLLGAGGLYAASLYPQLKAATPVPSATLAPMAEESTPMAMPMPVEGNSVGVLRFQDGTAALDQITISAALAAPEPGTQYEAWLVGDSGEQRRSLGTLAPNAAGQYVLTYVDSQSRNMLDGFSRMEVTVEPNPDDSPNPTGQVAYSSGIPSGTLMHIRHLLVAIDENPNHIGMVVGLVNDARLVKASTDALLSASSAGDAAAAHLNAEQVVNLIVGKQDPNYKDWNNDGQINDPGDGYGLLLNGDQAGYVGGVIDHAELSAQAPDSTEEIQAHSEHVIVCAQNVESWATQLRDIAMRIAQAPPEQDIQADVRSAGALGNQMLEGIDIDGNETIDPIPGEGGAMTAYEHANYMADMPVLAGKDQLPAMGQ
jgi:serine/threonine-protein kinase